MNDVAKMTEMQDAQGPHTVKDAIVSFRDVQKSYDGETLVIDDLNLEVQRGEFLTLLGPSGSGKTTCLMMLAGFEMPTGGQILLDGAPITNLPPHKRGIGMVFQNYALFPHMTVAENVAFPLSVRRLSKSEIAERVEQALSMVQLAGYGGRKPSQLSGGQQQRVAVARALVFKPKLVLMDEPLGALDKQLREQMQLEIKHIHGDLGVTLVYVTHDQSEALTMSDRIAVFNNGRVQQLASPTELYETPRNAFVAGFIGENNRLSGTVSSLNGSYCTVRLENGDLVQALAVNCEGAKAKTLLSIRPERVLVGEAAESCENRFPATIHELIYLGDHLRVRLAACGRDDIVTKIANVGEALAFHAGQQLTIGWRARDCRALDATG